jgi:15-cis-phytoene synthase/lycopene beta-cyclase
VKRVFPSWVHAHLLALPIYKPPKEPLDGLLEGFYTDMHFPRAEAQSKDSGPAAPWPIQTEADLKRYAHCVAEAVGKVVVHQIFHHTSPASTSEDVSQLLVQAKKMGTALQYVNIARDIRKDAMINRVYIPATWLREARMTEEEVIAASEVGERFCSRLLTLAAELFEQSQPAIQILLEETRAGARVAVESYMDIGRRFEQSTCEDVVTVEPGAETRGEHLG